MHGEAPSPRSGRLGSARARLLLLVGGAGAAIVAILAIVMIAMAPPLASVLPRERAGVRLGSPLPPGDEFAEINRVTHWPPDWIAAVCDGPVYQLRIPYKRLPHATAGAACKARVRPDGEVVDLTIARFPAELPMQIDLLNEGYQWYAFAFDRREMISFATFSEVTVTDPRTGLGESPVLQPLKQFGFNSYHDPGP
jgi:hypothetical protein